MIYLLRAYMNVNRYTEDDIHFWALICMSNFTVRFYVCHSPCYHTKQSVTKNVTIRRNDIFIHGSVLTISYTMDVPTLYDGFCLCVQESKV